MDIVNLSSDFLSTNVLTKSASLADIYLRISPEKSINLSKAELSPDYSPNVAMHLMEPWGGVGPTPNHPKHGLVFESGWNLKSQHKNSAALVLNSDNLPLAHLTAKFELHLDYKLVENKLIIERKMVALEDGVFDAGGIHPYFSQRLSVSEQGPKFQFEADYFISNSENILGDPVKVPQELNFSEGQTISLNTCYQFKQWAGIATVSFSDDIKIILRDEGEQSCSKLNHLTIWRSDENWQVFAIEPSLAALASTSDNNVAKAALTPRTLKRGESSQYKLSFEFVSPKNSR